MAFKDYSSSGRPLPEASEAHRVPQLVPLSLELVPPVLCQSFGVPVHDNQFLQRSMLHYNVQNALRQPHELDMMRVPQISGFPQYVGDGSQLQQYPMGQFAQLAHLAPLGYRIDNDGMGGFAPQAIIAPHIFQYRNELQQAAGQAQAQQQGFNAGQGQQQNQAQAPQQQQPQPSHPNSQPCPQQLQQQTQAMSQQLQQAVHQVRMGAQSQSQLQHGPQQPSLATHPVQIGQQVAPAFYPVGAVQHAQEGSDAHAVCAGESGKRAAKRPQESKVMEPVKRSRLVWTPELHKRFEQAVENAGGISVAVPKSVLEVRRPKNVLEVRSRLVWTPELHQRFELAVANAGGVDVAVPKSVLEHMGVAGLTRDNVASHLQKHRKNVKKCRPGHTYVLAAQRSEDETNSGTNRVRAEETSEFDGGAVSSMAPVNTGTAESREKDPATGPLEAPSGNGTSDSGSGRTAFALTVNGNGNGVNSAMQSQEAACIGSSTANCQYASGKVIQQPGAQLRGAKDAPSMNVDTSEEGSNEGSGSRGNTEDKPVQESGQDGGEPGCNGEAQHSRGNVLGAVMTDASEGTVLASASTTGLMAVTSLRNYPPRADTGNGAVLAPVRGDFHCDANGAVNGELKGGVNGGLNNGVNGRNDEVHGPLAGVQAMTLQTAQSARPLEAIGDEGCIRGNQAR